MRCPQPIRIAALLSMVTTGSAAVAQDGSWTNNISGNWSNAAMWGGGIIANGANSTATFDLPLATPVTVTLDTIRTIGNLIFDNSGGNNLGWTLRGANTLTLSNSIKPNISVGATSANANLSTTMTTILAGAQGFTKTGAGNLLLSTNNPNLTGGIDVAGGVLTISGGSGINPLGANTVTLSGGTLRLGSGGGFNQRMVVPVGTTFATSGITATMDGGTTLGGNTWYALGQNVGFPTTGLPMGTTITSLANPGFQYSLQPATSRNAMMLDNGGGNTTGRFTLVTPTLLNDISFLTSSGNGVGTITATIHYSDGTDDATGLTFTSPDWFFVPDNVAIVAEGRINAGGYADVNSGNPRLYDQFFPNPNPASPISSIDLSWTGGANTHSAIFAMNAAVLNGDPAQNFTNNVMVTADSTIDVRAVAGGTLGNVSIGTNTLAVTGVSGTTLGLGAITLTGDATISPAAGVTVTTGALTDGGVVRTVTKGGGGDLTLTSASPGLSTGTNVVINAGAVNMNNASALGTAPKMTVNGGNLNLGPGINPSFSLLAGASGTVNLNGNALTLSGGSGTFSGLIANGTGVGSLIKTGAGVQTLAGASTFTGGVTVSGTGALALANPTVLGSNSITLTGGGTLSVAGIPAASVTGFGGAGTGWTANGAAMFPGSDVLQLTDNVGGQFASAWNNTRVPTGAFSLSFQYNVPAAGAPPADGITVGFQNQGLNAIATVGGGGSLGYQGITPSAALAINIYPPNTTGGVGSGIKALLNGQAPGNNYTAIAPINPGLVGTPTDVVINYDGVNITVDFSQAGNTFSSGSVPFDIPGAVGGNAFIGFTGATGGATAQQQIANFIFNSLPQTTYANNVSVAAGNSGTVNVAATGSAFNITMGTLSLGTDSTLNIGADAGTPANQAFGLRFGATTLAGNNTINVGTNGIAFGTATLGAVDGTGSLTKTGSGVLILTSAGNYAGGTNVNGGRLIATNTTGSATGSGPVNVNNGGTLGGNGIIGGNVIVNNGGTIAPGSPLFPANAPGILRANANVTFNGGSFAVKLNGAGAAGADYDQLSVGGTLSFGTNSASLSTTLGYAPSAGDTLTIIRGGAIAAGQFLNLPNNALFPVGTFSGQLYGAQIQYSAANVILTNFQPIPEPTHILLAGAGVAGLAQWRRKRRMSASPDAAV